MRPLILVVMLALSPTHAAAQQPVGCQDLNCHHRVAHRKAAEENARLINKFGNRGIGMVESKRYGWFKAHPEQFACLEALWTKESDWQVRNPNKQGSGADGIPQALPPRKMASAGADWATNPVTQIKWGLDYIKRRYGSPCQALDHSKALSWY